MNRFKKIILSMLCFILSGCTTFTNETIDLEIDEEKINKIEVNVLVDTCKFIKTINHENFEYIAQNKNTNHEYYFNQHSVVCEEFKADSLGKREISYIVNGIKTVYTATVIDTTIPEFIDIQDVYVIEKGNVYFNLDQLIQVKDNFDIDITKSFVGKYDIQKPGEYKIQLLAKDKSENIAKKDIIVKVVDSLAEKEKELEELKNKKQDIQVAERQVEVIRTVPAPSVPHTESGGSTQPIENKKLPLKRFYTKDYNKNHNAALQACHNYALSSRGGGCSPFKNSTGNWDGYEFIP